MVAAPPSCRAATYRAPPAIIALVRRKLPLPTTPKTWSAPRPASARPTASATVTARSAPGSAVTARPPQDPRSSLDQRQDPRRAARSAADRQRGGHQHRAGRRQGRQVAQLGQSVLSRAQEVGVARERRVEGVRRAGIRADGLHAYADDRGLFGKPPCAPGRDARAVPGVEEAGLIIAAGVPAGPVQQPAALRQRAVLVLPRPHMLD